MKNQNESNQKNKNKFLNYIKSNIFTLILIALLIYMKITGSYVYTHEQPIYVETCKGYPIGYVEKPINGEWQGVWLNISENEYLKKNMELENGTT